MAGSAVPAPTRLASPDRARLDVAARGDAAAFDEIVAARVDGIYRLAFAILRSEADARDATQVAFVTAWRELPRLRDLDRFDAWIRRILVNACRDEIRRRARARVREIDIAAHGPGEGRAIEVAGVDLEEHVGRSDEIRRAFAALTPDQRSILVLHHVEGRSIDEVAALSGIPSGTAKWRLFAARQALDRALREAS